MAIENGERANWLRGAWGGVWLPEQMQNGGVETVSIDDFLEQISELNTIGYIQLKLTEAYIYSPVHTAPHDVLESLWEGDTDANGDPINLIVPRASSGVDPFYNWLIAIKAAGLKTQVYVNSSNMLERTGMSNPDSFSEVTARWKDYCDTNAEVVAFVNSHPDIAADDPENRKYMFCYAEFILKEYAIRYGDLIDGWIFDSADYMVGAGDDATSGVWADQKVYGAFADAVHAGNPYAPVAFNNGPNREDDIENPFSAATRYDDYMFGHPYNGGKSIGSVDNGVYDLHLALLNWIYDRSGNVHTNDGRTWAFDNKVVGHFYPPMSTTSWNSGITAALSDDDFNWWNEIAITGGGSISWGLPLNRSNVSNASGPILTVRDWAFSQLEGLDEHMSQFVTGMFNIKQDIGSPAYSGNSSYTRSSGKYIINGSGADIYDASDSFYFPSKYHAGDGEVIARVNTVEDTNKWAKAGVMFRASSAAGAANVLIAVRPDRRVTMQYRTATNGSTVSLGTIGNATDTKWVKLVRDGSLYTGYYSADGEAWTKVSDVTISGMPNMLLVGLAVTSHDVATRCRAAIFNVSVSSQPLGFFTSAVNVGSPGLSGSMSHEDGAYVLEGSGNDIWSTSDNFFYTSQLRNGDQTMIARVADLENTNTWAKSGIMMRESLDANAKHVMVAVRPDKKVAMFWRNTTGGSSAYSGLVGDTTNAKWVKLVRSGDSFTGYYSTNGTTWTTLATKTVSMAADVEVGLATCSHSNASLTSSTFTDISID
ncbi:MULTISPECIES: DUF1349 domain-containing protein [unclassified Lentimonas]|uniref:DUF1349 domain-containing protein n=1 Tax=unclassified Lentimonas TaxID=2630993 RepID=UPI00138A6735|nr:MULTISPECIES: DUF1349 domain-containing protein [unclassified Lentimonas]